MQDTDYLSPDVFILSNMDSEFCIRPNMTMMTPAVINDADTTNWYSQVWKISIFQKDNEPRPMPINNRTAPGKPKRSNGLL